MSPGELRQYIDQVPERVRRVRLTIPDLCAGSAPVVLELEFGPAAGESPPARPAPDEEWPGLTDLGIRVPQRG